MHDADTTALLHAYVCESSERAFAEIVRRHIDLVYSTALRRVGGDAHLASDVAQLVFTDLAVKAPALPERVVLAGWLHHHTCFRAATMIRGERRRRAREEKAAAMENPETTHSDAWAQLAPVVDDALNRLPQPDREAIVLRFFAGKSLVEIGRVLGVNEDAAQKRVSRALEKLRVCFARRGIATTGSALSAALAAQAVQAAPAALVLNTAPLALAGALALKSAPAAVSLFTPIIMATKGKILIASIAGTALVALVVSTHRENVRLREELAVTQKTPARARNASVQRDALGAVPTVTPAASVAKLSPEEIEARLGDIIRERLWRADQREFSRILDSIDAKDMSRALAFVARVATGEARRLLNMELINRWARLDPAAAAQWAAALPNGRDRDELRLRISEFWSEKDPEAALRVAGPSGGAFRHLAERSPARAAEQAMQLPRGETRGIALSIVARTWFDRDPEGVVKWIGSLTDGDDKGMALEVVIHSLADANPRETARYVAALPNHPRLVEVGRIFAAQWADLEAAAAAAWVDTLPGDSALRRVATGVVAERWAVDNPPAAARWIDALPTGDAREAAISNFVRGAVLYDAPLAAQWARVLTDEKARFEAIEHVAQHWLRSDPEAAGKWLDETGLSAERRKKLEGVGP